MSDLDTKENYLSLSANKLSWLLPVWKSWRLKSTEGLSTSMMIIWALSGIFLGNYNIGANLAVPLWIQPQIFTLIAYMCAIQSMYYVRKWSAVLSISVLCIICVISGAIEYGLVTAFQVCGITSRHMPKRLQNSLISLFKGSTISTNWLGTLVVWCYTRSSHCHWIFTSVLGNICH